jgi:hypothetical protein
MFTAETSVFDPLGSELLGSELLRSKLLGSELLGSEFSEASCS